MDDHKWGFALEEAVKEVEEEINRKENKKKKKTTKQKQQHQHDQKKKKKWGIVGRIFDRTTKNEATATTQKDTTVTATLETKDVKITIDSNSENNNETTIATTTNKIITNHQQAQVHNTEQPSNNEEQSQPSTTSSSSLATPNSPIVDLKQSCNSPIMGGGANRKRTLRKTGVAERNETERKVVYKTLKNYNQIDKLHDYDLV